MRSSLQSGPVQAAACLAALVGLGAAAPAQVIRQAQPYVVRDVRLSADEDAPRVSLVLRDGRIERVLEAGAQLPFGARDVDGKGMLALPAFVDACTRTGVELPEPVADRDLPPDEGADVLADMRLANRKGLQPAFSAARQLALDPKKLEGWRKDGFGALLVAPLGELMAGTSALATTRHAAPRDVLLAPEVAVHGALRASGRGYPSTLMGYVAHLRQFLLDAQHHRELERRYAAGRAGPRPPHDPDLELARRLLDGELRLVAHADSRGDIERWLELVDAFGLQVALSGGREAWRVADELAARGIPVILTLDWGEEPKDPHEKKGKGKGKDQPGAEPRQVEEAPEKAPPPEQVAPSAEAAQEAGAEPAAGAEEADEDDEARWIYEEPLAVREERRREWLEDRDCALRLREAGVAFCFGSEGQTSSELLKKVRQLVEAGLPAEAAVAALTRDAARVLGADAHLGALEPGRDATFALWTKPPMEKGAQVAWLFVDGFAHEHELEDEDEARGEPDEGVSATGTWELVFESEQGERTATAVLEMEEGGSVSGTVRSPNPAGEGELTTPYEGHVSGRTLTLKGTLTMGETEIRTRIEAQIQGDTLDGEAVLRGPWGESRSKLRGTRKPGGARSGEVLR